MEKNHSSVSEFILLGFSEPPEHKVILFVFFFSMYLITLLANGTIILVTRLDTRLHTPMYFFISIFSSVDICLATCTVPKYMFNIFSEKIRISFSVCFLQLHFYLSFGNMSDFLLAIMAVDRYISISRPLHYAMLMSKGVRVNLMLGCSFIVSLEAAGHTVLAARLSYCASNEIRHYYCDLLPLFKLSCSDPYLNKLLFLADTSVFMLSPILCIIISYVLIIVTIWRLPSTESRSKAFSTCSSHLCVVAMTYAPLLYVYISPASDSFIQKDLIVSVLFTLGCCMLNPFVYSIRNKEFKRALVRTLSKRPSFRFM